MKLNTNQELDNIKGGSTISGSVITAFTEVIELLFNAGKSVGTSFRRLGENKLCSLE